jgi:hypothetical protein
MIIYNPLSDPVVYSNDGHILGGDERREVEALDEHGKRSVDRGYIVLLDREKTEEETASTEEEPPGKVAQTSGRGRAAKTKAKEEDSGASTGSDDD